MIEASSSAYPGVMLARGKQIRYGGAPMRCSTNQHPFYGGIDWHARSLYVCLVSQDGPA
jgi:hypothetical protein